MHASSLRPRSALRAFINNEASGGLVLTGAAAVALDVANSPLSGAKFKALHSYMLGPSLLHCVDDAQMTAFLSLVGLEIQGNSSLGRAVIERRSWEHIACANSSVLQRMQQTGRDGSAADDIWLPTLGHDDGCPDFNQQRDGQKNGDTSNHRKHKPQWCTDRHLISSHCLVYSGS